MSGRNVFDTIYPILWIFSLVLFLIPKIILSRVWILLDLFPGLLGVGMRYIFALRLAKKIGRNIFFGRGVEILSWENLTIGSNVSIHKDCYIEAIGGVVIGDDVSIAHASSILTAEHTWDNTNSPIRSNPIKTSQVQIANDVWIGCGVRILAGVEISSRVVVAAGSVVITNIESNSLAAGVPASKKKEIS